ncbi:hypothetical protein [Haloplasma contractile]|uniref:DUF8058 domain-containing protein n=1 Tax=Haloplasma contractile SSD-17B TaxID=1033810 RepID=U2DYC2_9MOLU|nr:hypothetical protein [Haloplasma contractile]ERJ13257.1 hypothetical protein HLPCO_000886 [Haloplasma contractile SSD-17B]
MRKVASIFSMIIGTCMLSMWIMFLVTGQIPELETIPKEIIMHILIESITAILLITSGVGLLKRTNWSDNLYLFTSGMLCYTLVNSAGYYLQTNDFIFIVMFGVFLLFQLLILYYLFIKKRIN